MKQFTEENIEWLVKLIEEAESRTDQPVKLTKLKDLKTKVLKLGKHELKISITPNQIEEVDSTIKELESIVEVYTNQADISLLDEYDKLKKQMSTKLEYLSTFKDIFLDEVSYLEEVLKKEIRVDLSMDIKENDPECTSFTQADKLVDKDPRYTSLRDQVYFVKRVASRIKTKYDFYMKFWQMVFQSVSTASKEKYANRHNNAT